MGAIDRVRARAVHSPPFPLAVSLGRFPWPFPPSGSGLAMLYYNHEQPFVPHGRRRIADHPRGRGAWRGVACDHLGLVVTPPPIRLSHVTLRRGGRDVVRDLSGV